VWRFEQKETKGNRYMKTQASRLARVEQKTPQRERQFISWQGNPWTPEQMAEAICREPNRRIFWRSLRQGEGQ
jgi:hypothetical protein